MLNTSFSPWPSFTREEVDAVQAVLLSGRTNYWTGGQGRGFEREFAAWCEVKHAVAVANGTVALELALKALGIGPGDEVVVTPRTFFATASSVVMVGARPVFAEVDAESQNITAASIRAVLTPRSRAVICVHLAGWPCEMDPIMELAEEKGLHVIEDCAQAHGARYRGRPVGGLGHVAAWSFCQDKIITTGGEGGMLTTNDSELWSRAWSHKDHGKSYGAVYDRAHSTGFRWLHESFGTNWRLTEMQAAIGRLQLRRLDQWQAARRRHAEAIYQAANICPALRAPAVPGYIEHAWYKCYLFIRPQYLAPGWDRDRIMAAINDQGVPCYSGTCSEIYRERAFVTAHLRPASPLPTAHELGQTSLMFLVHPTLTPREIDQTCTVLQQVMAQATNANNGAAFGTR